MVKKPSWFSPIQEVYKDENCIGDLTMIKRLSYALAEAHMPDRTVQFGYKGWNSRKLFIQDAQGKEIATVKSLSWWGWSISVEIDGTTYEWKVKNWWGTQYAWYASGKEIIVFRARWMGYEIDIDSLDNLNSKETLLLFYGIYLMKLYEMDAAGSGAAV